MTKRKQKQFPWPVALVALGLVLILGSLIWGIYLQQASADPITSPGPGTSRVSLGDAYAAYQTGAAVFVDVRGEPYFSEQRIPGAVSIPYDQVELALEELEPDQWIITYCT